MSDVVGARERGRLLLDLNRPQEALEPLARAIASDPEDSYSYTLMAYAHVRLKDHAAALDAATTAVGLDADNAWAHRLRALSLLGLGRKREAREAAEASVRLWPDVPEGLIVLAEALQADGDEAGALQAAQHAVRVAPEHAGAAGQLGLILLAHERWSDAEAAFVRTLSLNPDSAEAHNNLAVARLAQGRRAAALEGLERAARTDPGLEVARQNLAHAGSARPWIGVVAYFAYLVLAAFGLVGFGALIGGDVKEGAPLVVGCALVAAGVHQVVRMTRPLSAASSAMLDDQRRARRWKPWRWDGSRVSNLRPWWWIQFTRLTPWKALGVNLIAIPCATPIPIIAVGLLLTLPASIWRVWKWERRKRAGAGSWRPPSG